MVSTRSNTKQMITRSKANGITTFSMLTTQIRTRKRKTDDSSTITDTDTDSVLTSLSNVTQQYVVDIDFDDAHYSWMSNKKRNSNGTFTYICGFVQKNNKLCQRDCSDRIGLYSGCKKHYKWEEKIKK